jgi:hypothetical protein
LPLCESLLLARLRDEGSFTKTFGFADGLKRRDLCKGEILRAGFKRPALKKGFLKEARSAEKK